MGEKLVDKPKLLYDFPKPAVKVIKPISFTEGMFFFVRQIPAWPTAAATSVIQEVETKKKKRGWGRWRDEKKAQAEKGEEVVGSGSLLAMLLQPQYPTERRDCHASKRAHSSGPETLHNKRTMPRHLL